ncbi:MAG: RHS repeat-associated core domain-containing protein [Halioglobus sp.]
MNQPAKHAPLTTLVTFMILLFSSVCWPDNQEWRYTYNNAGQVLTADGPRVDINDITNFTYDGSGNRSTRTNALGHLTRMQNYNERGQAGSIIDANGVETVVSYSPRGWILSSTVKDPGGNSTNDAQTNYSYDNEGQLLGTTLPNATALYNEYDTAQRLVAIRNNLGERIDYQLDNAGNRIAETTTSANASITRDVSRAYDELNRLIRLTGAAGQITSFSYDKNSNQVTVTDGNLNNTTEDHDALDRVIGSYGPLNSNALYLNDEQDNLVQVTDPKGLVTTYTYDGRKNLLQLSSPDTGVTNYTYDAADNRLTQSDANGVLASFSYDALNRLLSTSYPNNTLNVTYGYDAGTYGKGYLTSISDHSGTTLLDYDPRGNVVYQGLDTGDTQIGLSYGYNTTDQLIKITYPSERVVDFTRGADGLVTTVSTTSDAGNQLLADNADYLPFGPMNALTYGNGVTYAASYDLDYRVSSMAHSALRNAQYAYDDVDNITGIANNTNPAANQIFTYDALNRLNDAEGIYGSLSYTYDANGNRLSYTDDTSVDGYSYDASSHRLLSTKNWDYQYDNNGNQIAKITRANGSGDGTLYRYDDNNRLVEVAERTTIGNEQFDSVLATYSYNNRGQRARKVTSAGTTHSVYSPDDLLLAEVDQDGLVLREYIYLNGQPLAVAQTTVTQAAPTTGTEIVIDNLDGETSSTGSWEDVRKKGAWLDYYGRSESLGNTYRWTPTGLNASDYEVWGWWPKTKKNNETANYTIQHSGQSSVSVQNQSTPGKKWIKLGTYTFSGDGSEYIEISDLGGKTAADGIRLVELISPPPEATTALYYIHNDHLGTPQILTDQNGTVAWSADYHPFGEVSINTSSIVNNLRFPGQYFDEETNLHQNYFRDYDPKIGRYVQSDPIGLQGGLNTYTYLSSNTLNDIDPSGLVCVNCAAALIGAGVGAISGATGALATGGNPWSSAAIGAAVGAATAFVNPALTFSGAAARGAFTGAVSNAVGQGSGGGSFNWGSFLGSTIGGSYTGAITLGAGPVSGAILGWTPSTGASILGEAYGEAFEPDNSIECP